MLYQIIKSTHDDVQNVTVESLYDSDIDLQRAQDRVSELNSKSDPSTVYFVKSVGGTGMGYL